MLPDDPRHGKYAGSKAHRKDGEEPCEPCRLARNEYLLARKRIKHPRSTRNAERLEDLRWMTETGETATGAAQRLGISYDSLEKWCLRHAHAEWRRLRSREVHLAHNGGSNQWTAA